MRKENKLAITPLLSENIAALDCIKHFSAGELENLKHNLDLLNTFSLDTQVSEKNWADFKKRIKDKTMSNSKELHLLLDI